ncbi:hypothetical protein COU57_06795 [Candidatus Pacearchaeota archaeon CG10_big_fil_rev_8_21_14_0_10_32_14]|nr:MAG: hypothetical protein COU57_06795 [Candidatus Pacearchaeota archaeon CG10_big_fil_rev_8_21_14_0_10_32_14]
MIINYIILEIILFFLFGTAFVVCANLQGHYIYSLRKSLGNRSPNFYDIIFLWKYDIPGFIIPHPITILKYVWFNGYEIQEAKKIVIKIRIYQLLSILFFIFALITPLMVEIIR